MDLHIQHLRVEIAGQATPILDIPELYVPGGTQLAVSGPSGSGKTTLINQICGLAFGSPGSVLWNDTDIHRLQSGAKDRWRGEHIGLIMQDFHLIDGLSALENVLLPDAIRHFPRQTRKKAHALELLERLGIEHPDQSVETHSRGEQQRIAIARALLNNPPILVADEPTASLDSQNGAQIANLLIELADASQATLICVTHDEQLRNALTHQLALDHGHIVHSNLTGDVQS